MTDVMIEAMGLSKSYGPVTALSQASFKVRRGEVVGFVGPNGAGKTTTMKILTCFIAPTEGTAKVNGIDIWEDSVGVRTAIGYLPEHNPLYIDMIVLDYLEWCARMRGLKGDDAHKAIKLVVEQTSLGDVISKEIRALSKGFRQRVGLAQALVHRPPLLILDEPMSGLDPNQALEIRDLIKAIGKERTVILSTHNLAEVQAACDRVLVIAKGKLVADDTPDELRARAGRPKYIVSILRDGAQDSAAKDALGRMTGVESVRDATPSDASKTLGSELILEILPGKDVDLRADIFRCAVSTGFVLVGLERRGENLEQVFRDLTLGTEPLTSSSPNPPPAPPSAAATN